MGKFTAIRFILALCLAAFFTHSDAQANPYSFVYVSDVQGLTDTGLKVRDSIIQSGMKNLVMAGDMNGDPSLHWSDIWNSWLQAGLYFDVVALGNHRNGTYEDEVKWFGLPGEFYATVRGDIRFLVLNSDNVATADQQAAWFADQLRFAREKMIIVMFHHSPYTISKKHRWEERREFHLRIRPLLEQFKQRISAILVGHDHFQAIYQMGGIPVIISSATAYPKVDHPARYRDGNVEIQTAWLYRGGIGWARVDANASTGEIVVNFVDAERNAIRCSTSILNHTVRLAQSCSISGTSGIR